MHPKVTFLNGLTCAPAWFSERLQTVSARCLTGAARLETGGEVDQSDSLVYFPEDREAGFVLPCTGKPRSDLRLRTHQQNQMREFRKQKGRPSPYSWSKD